MKIYSHIWCSNPQHLLLLKVSCLPSSQCEPPELEGDTERQRGRSQTRGKFSSLQKQQHLTISVSCLLIYWCGGFTGGYVCMYKDECCHCMIKGLKGVFVISAFVTEIEF